MAVSFGQGAGGIGCFWIQCDTTRHCGIGCTLLGEIGDTNSMELGLATHIVVDGVGGLLSGVVGVGRSGMGFVVGGGR